MDAETKNFRIQIWYDAMPDKLHVGTISVCAGDAAMAVQMAREHTKYRLIAEEKVFWQVREAPLHPYAIA